MPINTVNESNTFDEWRIITNLIKDAVGDKDTLNTTTTTSLVASINEVFGKLGNNSSLNTTETSTLVLALNEVLTKLGDVSTLTTTATSSAVAAINELDTDTETNASNIGTIESLTTSANTLVGAINEILTERGVLTNLNTDAQDSVVNSINEVLGRQVVSNSEPNNGRFASEGMTTKSASTFSNTSSIVQVASGGSIGAGDKFIDDNTDGGGAGGSMGTDVTSLLTEIDGNSTSRRYGYEWFVAEFTTGDLTSDGTVNVSSVDYYQACKNSGEFLHTLDEKVTFCAWVRVETASKNMIIGDTNTTTYINGSLHTYTTPIDSTDGWVHVRQVKTLSSADYDTVFPAIYMENEASNVWHMALPVLTKGEQDIGLHKSLV